MKTRSLFGLMTILAIVGGGVLFSFALNEDEPTYRKIEVIHSANGKTVTYDTLVPTDSNLDAEAYLAQLGLENSSHLSIIRLSSNLDEVDFSAFTEENGKVEKENVVIRKKKNITIDHTTDSTTERVEIDLDEIQQEVDKALKNLDKESVVIMKQMGSVGEDIYQIFDELDISFDSIKVQEFNIDTTFKFNDGESKVFFKMMGSDSMNFDMDSMMNGHSFWKEESNISFDVDVDCDDFHKEMEGLGDDFKMEVRTSGDEEFTVVLVTEGIKNPKETAKVSQHNDKNTLKVFPNPAKEFATLQLDLDKKEQTKITISDVRGNVIKTYDLGKFKGKYRENIDVSEWTSGLYLIQLSHGDYRKIEKFVKE